jgi:hypothetical protein
LIIPQRFLLRFVYIKKKQSVIMSADNKIDQEVPSSSRRHFLIIPSFNPERRHSWGNVVLNPSQKANVATSTLIIATNADYHRR